MVNGPVSQKLYWFVTFKGCEISRNFHTIHDASRVNHIRT